MFALIPVLQVIPVSESENLGRYLKQTIILAVPLAKLLNLVSQKLHHHRLIFCSLRVLTDNIVIFLFDCSVRIFVINTGRACQKTTVNLS